MKIITWIVLSARAAAMWIGPGLQDSAGLPLSLK